MMMVKLEVGGEYASRGGDKVTITGYRPNKGPFSWIGDNNQTYQDGGFWQLHKDEDGYDLIAEWTDTPAEVIGENVRVIPINEAPERDFGKILRDALEKGSAEVMEKIKNTMPLNPEEYGRAPDYIEPSTRARILDTAKEYVTKDRQATHGAPEDTFGLIAAYWSAHLDKQITAVDVATMMALLKLARAKANPSNDDNWIDLAGYAACAGELVE